MRPGTSIGKRRRARLGVRALIIGIPASAAAISAGGAPGASAPPRVQITPLSEHIAAAGDLAAPFTAPGTTAWADASSATVGRDASVRVRPRSIIALAGQTV